MNNPTLSDVARVAGVSYATADRVVNRRGNVAEKSIRKVREAMQSLGYVRNVAAANLSRGRIYRLAFVLPTGPNAFFRRVRAHLADLAGHLMSERVDIEVIDVAAFSAEALKDCLESIADRSFDGVAIVGLQADELAGPLSRLREQGVPVIGLISDVPQEHSAGYVGIDNVVAGRTAARLVGLSHGGRTGRVQVFAGSLEARDHAERLAGFEDVLAADFPDISLLEPILTRDDANSARDLAAHCLKTDGAITAIYNVGAGNSGLIDALRSLGRPIFGAVHELVPHTHQALRDDVIDLVIDQRPDIEVNRACTILRALIDARQPPPLPVLVPMIYVKDNLPPDVPISK